MQTPARTTLNVGTPPTAPYSHVVSAGGLIYLSGALADGPDRQILHQRDVAGQTREVMEKLRVRLEAAGSSLAQVVSVMVYLTSSSDFATMNEVFGAYWPLDPPTRTTVITKLVRPDALVEMTMVAVENGADRQVVHPAGWQRSPSPYSYGIQAGDALFLSGLISRNGRDNSLVPGDVAAQTRVVLDNAGEILAAAGRSFADVVSARVYLPDGSTFEQMNTEYRRYFSSAPPVRATVRAGLAAAPYTVEMTLIASSEPRTILEPGGAQNPNLSTAIVAGGRVYLSGMLGNQPDTAGDVGRQTTETLARIDRALQAAGCTRSDVVDSLVYLTDVSGFAAMNDAYRAFFGEGSLPARATVEAGLFAPDGLVEIMMTAVKP
jgi:enamine deaminase RidA (YjgF/YER057c/UK114 family)